MFPDPGLGRNHQARVAEIAEKKQAAAAMHGLVVEDRKRRLHAVARVITGWRARQRGTAGER